MGQMEIGSVEFERKSEPFAKPDFKIVPKPADAEPKSEADSTGENRVARTPPAPDVADPPTRPD